LPEFLGTQLCGFVKTPLFGIRFTLENYMFIGAQGQTKLCPIVGVGWFLAQAVKRGVYWIKENIACGNWCPAHHTTRVHALCNRLIGQFACAICARSVLVVAFRSKWGIQLHLSWVLQEAKR
jgi:hypothetical protein